MKVKTCPSNFGNVKEKDALYSANSNTQPHAGCFYNSALLARLDEKDRLYVLSKCAQRIYKKGEQIVRVMARDSNLYFIDTGTVRVTLFSREGREVNFIDMHSGENFGEISAIDSGPRSANVIAQEDTVITVMSADVLQELLLKYPTIGVELLNQLTAMVRRLCDRIFEFSTLATKSRIHAELVRLARANQDLDGVVRIHNPPTHAEFASRISCHREAVSRELRELQKAGVIVKQKRKLVVPDLAALQIIVEQMAVDN